MPRLSAVGISGLQAGEDVNYAFQSVARSWRSQEPEELEPASERGEREKPHRLRRLCMRAVAEKLISLPKAANLIREPVAHVEAELKGPQVVDKDHDAIIRLPKSLNLL
jgi:predicted HTH domain antitoxin